MNQAQNYKLSVNLANQLLPFLLDFSKKVSKESFHKFPVIENDVMVGINRDKIPEDAKWDGLKSYVTNTDLPASEVIARYHGLWVVERAFRISKGTLETRPIFYFTERRIEVHVCICFMAYKEYKELQRVLMTLGKNLSVDRGMVMDIAKTISSVTIRLSDGTTCTKVMLLTPVLHLLTPLIPAQN